jgi:hypothetical protein
MQDTAATLIAHMAVQLGQLDRCLDKAVAHATAKKFDPDSLLTARLAPDQFALVRQIGSACDTAKNSVARLTGKTAPVHADDQKTVAECQARIRAVIAFITSTSAAEYARAADARIMFPWMPGKYLAGPDYLVQFAIPNFHFHYSHAYAILRHNGVELGKGDFLGNLAWHDA